MYWMHCQAFRKAHERMNNCVFKMGSVNNEYIHTPKIMKNKQTKYHQVILSSNTLHSSSARLLEKIKIKMKPINQNCISWDTGSQVNVAWASFAISVCISGAGENALLCNIGDFNHYLILLCESSVWFQEVLSW